jgi:hypothetical protein
MEDASFTVTLPGNSNMISHPTNRGNDYVVKLSSPLNFSGQTLNEDVAWEVAITTVQYTNRFYDLRENSTLYTVLEFNSAGAINSNVEKPKGVTELAASFGDASIADTTDVEKRILKTFRAAGHKPKGGKAVTSYAYGRVLATAGDYKSPMLLVTNLVSSFNALFGGTRYLTNMGIAVDGATGRLTFRVDNSMAALYMFTESPSLVHALGLTPKAIDAREPTVYGLGLEGGKTPRFDAVHSLYVYSDIVKEQRVGDSMSPLLDIVPVKGVPGNRIHHCVNPLTYLPVNREYIDSINIVIMDEYGKPVVFPDDVENVVCRLRFRRALRQHWPQV